jgi:hypothetical protein
VTDRDGMYVHVTAKGAMSFRMDCQPMSWCDRRCSPQGPAEMATLFLRRLGFGPERKILRNTLRNAVINWPDGDEGEKSHFPRWVKSAVLIVR